MTAPRPAFSNRRITRLLVMWLIALVLPLQGAAFGVFAVEGPAHLHSVDAAAPAVLEDVRYRKPGPAGFRHVVAPRGHFHAGNDEQRHHHGHDDSSVVLTHADEPATDDAVGPSGLVVLALIPSFSAPARLAGSAKAIAGRGWSLRTGFIQPLERPPRPG